MGLLNTLSFGVGVLAGAQIGLRAAWRRAPRPHPRVLAAILEHPLRLKYRDPAQTLGPFGLAEGMSVLDLGCGTGLFTAEMARQVGATGVVHSVDIQAALIDKARERVSEAGLAGRVRFHHSGAYRLPLSAESVDIAILIATFSEIPNGLLLLEELRRVLKPGGRIGISEEMPHPGYLPAPVIRNQLAEAGFRYGGQQGTHFATVCSILRSRGWGAAAGERRQEDISLLPSAEKRQKAKGEGKSNCHLQLSTCHLPPLWNAPSFPCNPILLLFSLRQHLR